MEPQSPKLNLDLSPPWLAGDRNDDPGQSSELRDYISRLEAELGKIEAFKRELPLSILFLTDAIARLKKEVGRDGGGAVAACEFDEIAWGESEIGDESDKKGWMSSAQLWSSNQNLSLGLDLSKPHEAHSRQAGKYSGGALSSFHGPVLSSPAKEAADPVRPSLCLVTARPADLKVRYKFPTEQFLPGMQSQRKQRRCWSPELHRRFIDALDRLGGPQVATPKQIREMMQVNGLTNDEVKSHLQKYRLHIRKLPNTGTSDKLFEGTLKPELNQPGSPEGPFPLTIRRGTRCDSPASRCDSMDDDYAEKSDSHSWEGD